MSIVGNNDYNGQMNPQAAHTYVDKTRSRLRLGPLCYALSAYDSWGGQILSALAKHLADDAADCAAVRHVHICRLRDPNDPLAFRGTDLPEHLQQPAWYCQKNPLNTIWVSPDISDIIWTAATEDQLGDVHYHLPWNTMIDDIIDRDGLMVHGGLALRDDRALLFLAPPGGGKSTTLATAPQGWQILSDDAALIWPDGDGCWEASPLPSWTNLTSRQPQTQPRTTLSCRLAGLIRIRKADRVQLTRLAPVQAVPALYRACSDYPMLVMADVDCRKHAFKLAANLARTLPCWQLELPLQGAVWGRLDDLTGGL